MRLPEPEGRATSVDERRGRRATSVIHAAFWSEHGADAVELATAGRGASLRLRHHPDRCHERRRRRQRGRDARRWRRPARARRPPTSASGAPWPSLADDAAGDLRLGNGDTVEAVIRYDGPDHYAEHAAHLLAAPPGEQAAGERPGGARRRAARDLDEANYRYHVLDDPTMEDQVYDRLHAGAAGPRGRRIRSSPRPDSPTQRVGARHRRLRRGPPRGPDALPGQRLRPRRAARVRRARATGPGPGRRRPAGRLRLRAEDRRAGHPACATRAAPSCAARPAATAPPART